MTCLHLSGQDFKFHEKNSMSDSIILYLKTRKHNTVLKISVPPTKEDNSLEIERQMYNLVKTKLSHWSPHFLSPLHSGHCSDSAIIKMQHSSKPNEARLYKEWVMLRMLDIRHRLENIGKSWTAFRKTLPSTAQKTQWATAQYLFYEHPEWKDKIHQLYFVQTPRMMGEPLQDFLQRKDLPKDVLRQILVQMSQALAVLAVHKIMHNDLHMFNVKIQTFKTLQKIEYTFPKKVIFCTKFVVTIFDFDRSFKPGMINSGLETYQFCKMYGSCNKFIAKWDFYSVLTNMLITTEDNSNMQDERKELLNILGRLYHARKELRVGSDAIQGLPCTCNKIDKPNDMCVECTQKSLHKLITPRTYFLRNIDRIKNQCGFQS